MRRIISMEKTDAGKDRRQNEKVTTEDEMIRQHHWLQGCEFEQALRDSGRQETGVLLCPWGHSPWVHKESDMTQWLNNKQRVYVSAHFLIIGEKSHKYVNRGG